MDASKTTFLRLIEDYIHGVRSENFYVDEAICRYANNHQLSAIIYNQTKTPELITAFSRALFRYENRRSICEAVMKEMAKEGIAAFQIKGTVIASFYPHPALRTMGDTDIVVSDMEKAHSVMLRNGFSSITQCSGREWQYQIKGMEFELHDRLVYDEAINEDKITAFFNDYRKYVKDDGLDINFHFLFVIAHLRKHFMNSGVGFRQFLDVAMMTKNCSRLDWEWIEKQLSETGMLDFAGKVFYFIERWWKVKSPIQTDAVPEDFFEAATEHIFENGVFGFNNAANDNYLAANEARKGSKLGNALRVLFPGYKSLCTEAAFGFLKGRPILLPFAWIYRIIRGIFRGNVKAKAKTVGGKFVSDKYVARREEMFRNWGLSE